MARARKPVLNLEMYRHFAIVTIALTGTIALFAQGESSELAPTMIAQIQPVASDATPFNDEPVEPMLSEAVNWPHEPMDAVSVGSDTSVGGFESSSSFIPTPSDFNLTDRGYSREYLALLSDEERFGLIEQLRGHQDVSITAAEKRRAERLSSMRSGADGLD